MSRMLGCGPSKLIADGQPMSTSILPGSARVQPLGAIAARTIFSFGRGEDIGDVEVTGDVDVHAGRDVGLRVEVDDEGRDAAREGGGSEPERHRGLSDASLEGADAEYVHE